MAAPQGHAAKREMGSMSGQSGLHRSDSSLPPFKARVRMGRHEVRSSFSAQNRGHPKDAANCSKPDDNLHYAVSPGSHLLTTKMQSNIYIWGDAKQAASPNLTTATATSAQCSAAQSQFKNTYETLPDSPLPSQDPEPVTDMPGARTSIAAFPVGVCGGPVGRFAAISLGDGHAAAITVRGELLTWGRNSRGQCGHQNAAPSQGAERPTGHLTDDFLNPTCAPPQLVRFPLLTGGKMRSIQLQVRTVACGAEHTLTVTSAGVFAWGCNAFGQCGLGDKAPYTVPQPAAVPGLCNVAVCQLAAGGRHSLALTASSQVLSWGDGASGQLGHGDRRKRHAPTRLEALWALPVLQIAAGEAHSAAVTSNGHAFVWGCNFFGQLGLLTEQCQDNHAAGGGPSLPPQQQSQQQHITLARLLETRSVTEVQATQTAQPGQGVETSIQRMPSGRPATVARPPLSRYTDLDIPGATGGPSQRDDGSLAQTAHPQEGRLHLHLEHYRPQLRMERGTRSSLNPERRMQQNSILQDMAPHTSEAARRAGLRLSSAGGYVDPQWLLAMVEMGIPQRHARIALEETGNAGVEVASEWLFATDRCSTLDELSDSEPVSPITVADSCQPVRASGGAAESEPSRVEAAAGELRPVLNSCASCAGATGSRSRHDCERRWGNDNEGGSDGECGTRSALQTETVSGTGDSWYGSPGECDCSGNQGGGWNDLVVSEPRRVPLKEVRCVAAGARHTVAVTDGGVFAWGDGTWGALGLGDRDGRDLPCRLDAFAPAVATTPRSSRNSAGGAAMAAASQPYVHPRLCGGSSGGFAAGSGGSAAAAGSSKHVVITRVACGAQHTLFLAQDGSVYWCGTMPYSAMESVGGRNGGAVVTVAAAMSMRRSALHEPVGLDCDEAAKDGCLNSMNAPIAYSNVPRRLRLISGQQDDHGGSGARWPAAAGTAACPVVYDIVARGTTSAVLMCKPQELPQVVDPPCGQPLLDNLRAAISSAAQARTAAGVGELTRLSVSLKDITVGVKTILSNPAAISVAFGHRSEMGLDGQLLEDVFNSVRQLFVGRSGNVRTRRGEKVTTEDTAATVVELHRYSFVEAFQTAATALVDDLAAHVQLLGTPERAQVLLAALQHPLLSDPEFARRLLPKLAATVMGAPLVVRTWLMRWWSEYPGSLLERRVVAPLQAYLTRELGATKTLTATLMNVIKILARIEEANSHSNSLPPEAFYNAIISEKLDVQDHYLAWRQVQELPNSQEPPKGTPFSFCSYPFLLDARAKSQLLHLEATFQMEQSVAHARMMVQLYGRGAVEEQRAAEGPVLVKAASGGGICSGGSSDGISISSHDATTCTSSNRGGNNTSRNCSSVGSRRGGSTRIGSGSSAGSESLRSFFSSLLRRISSFNSRASSSIIDGTDDMDRFGVHMCLELPRPSECLMPGVHSDMCIVRVRRTHLVEDALEELGRQSRGDLLKPLRVHFIGEEGIDAGGVKKEFFALLMERLLSLDYGMMSYDEASRIYWFNSASLEPPDSYFLLGLVLGLAVYNRVLLAFPAPLLLYQKLRGGRELGLRDLEAWQPELARGMRELLEYDGPEPMSEVFGLTFSVDVNRFGHMETVPLKPGGELIPVTEYNRVEYVSLLAAWHMDGNVATQFEAFAEGFRVVCRGPAMSLFNAQELERLVCGNPRLDFLALRDAARYEGGYERDSPVVRWLWDIVLHELSAEDQRAFLKFFTGSDRSPLGGLGSLYSIIQRDGPDSHKLPTAHTCFNTLLLPEYVSREKLAALLRLAINNSEGFGLQ